VARRWASTRFLAVVRSKRLARYRRKLFYFSRQQFLALVLFAILGTTLASATSWERVTGGPDEWFPFRDDSPLTKALTALFFLCVAAFYSWRAFFRKNKSSAPCKHVAVTSLALAAVCALDAQFKAFPVLAGCYLISIGFLMTDLLDMHKEFRERKRDGVALCPITTVYVERTEKQRLVGITPGCSRPGHPWHDVCPPVRWLGKLLDARQPHTS
jgi:hypothetical protein